MNKLKLKKKKKKHIFTKITIVLLLVIFASISLIKYFSNKSSPILFSYAESETRKLTTLIINKAVTKQIASDNMNTDDLFEIVKNNDNDIQLITFNSINVTKMLNAITSLVQLNLKAIEEGNIDLMELPEDTLSSYPEDKLKQGIIYEIPMGVITNNSFLSNLGPKIPVKLHLIGDVVTGVNSKVSEYGINNALLEVGIDVTVTSRINLPFISKEVKVSTTVPVVMKIIQGNIPNMYLDSIKNSSNIVEKSN